MKSLLFLLCAICCLAATQIAFSQTPQHFTFTSSTGNNATMVIPFPAPTIDGASLTPGDEIGAFNPTGLCCGAVVWEENTSAGLTLWGDNDQTTVIDGFTTGQVISYKIWKQSTNTEYPNPTVTYTTGNGVYSINSIQEIRTMIVGTPPVLFAPNLLLPSNLATGLTNPVSFKWTSVTDAANYTIQISTQHSFATTIVNQAGVTDTTFSANNLQQGTVYYWHVRANNANGNSVWSAARQFTSAFPPLTQTILKAPADSALGASTSLSLVWYKVYGASTYTVQVSTNEEFGTVVINQQGVPDTILSVGPLENLTKYYWRVRAINTQVTGDWSSIWNFTTQAPPLLPPNLLSPADGTTGVLNSNTFIWAPVTNATTYSFQISKFPQFTNIDVDSAGITSTQCLIKKLSSNTLYYWRVRTLRGTDISDWSAPWSFTTIANTVGTPLPISPQRGAVNVDLTVKFLWYKVKNAYSYDIQVSQDPSFAQPDRDTTGVRDTSYTFRGFNYTTQYYWHVRAFDGTDYGDWSQIWYFTTVLQGLTPPALVYPMNGGTNIPLTFLFQWMPVTGADHFKIQMGTDSDFNSNIVDQDNVTLTNFSIENLNTSTTFYWRVQAKNSTMSSLWSNVSSFTTVGDGTIKPPDSWNFVSNTGSTSFIVVPVGANPRFTDRPFKNGDAVGVFYTDAQTLKCAGYGIWNGNDMNIRVWGDDTRTGIKDGFNIGESYTIKVWDGTRGVQFLAKVTYKSGPDNFKVDSTSVIGSLTATDSIIIAYDTLKIPVNAGWNIISSNVEPADSLVNNIFKNMSQSLKVLIDQAGNRYIPQYLDKIRYWTTTEGYWAYSTVNFNVNLIGNKVNAASKPIPLANGWNIMAYLLPTPQPVANLLSTINDNILLVKSCTGELYIPKYGVNSLNTLSPTKGYQVFAKKDLSFTYPTSIIVKDNGDKPQGLAMSVLNPTTTNTGNDMTFIVKASSPSIEDGYEVGVYSIRYELIASGTISNGIAAITVWGKDEMSDTLNGAQSGEPLTFKIFNTGTQTLSSLKLKNVLDLTTNLNPPQIVYTVNSVIYAEEDVTGVDDTENQALQLSCSPNPAGSSTLINFNINEPCKVNLTVFTIEGLPVANLVNGIMEKGGQSVYFNVADLPQGIYIARLQAGNNILTEKISVVK